MLGEQKNFEDSMIKTSSITLSHTDTGILPKSDTLTICATNDTFTSAVCSSDMPRVIDYTLTDDDREAIRVRILELVSGNSRIDIFRGNEGASVMHFALRSGIITYLPLLTDVIESLNKHHLMMCVEIDYDIE